MTKLLVLHGPNLDLLGQREPKLYGQTSLAALNTQLEEDAKLLGCTLSCQQSNAEHELMAYIVAAKREGVAGLIFNPAAFTHTSVALRDTLLAVDLPFIEVHLSNVFKREAFRHHSYFSDIAISTISGFGVNSYLLALKAISVHIRTAP